MHHTTTMRTAHADAWARRRPIGESGLAGDRLLHDDDSVHFLPDLAYNYGYHMTGGPIDWNYPSASLLRPASHGVWSDVLITYCLLFISSLGALHFPCYHRYASGRRGFFRRGLGTEEMLNI